LLINLYSFTVFSIDLENKKLKSKAEEQKLIRIKKQQDSLKSSLISLEEQRLHLQEKQDELKNAITNTRNELSQIDKEIKRLEKLSHQDAK
jgi:peptidoglycan hydrolase CwlO-like protein